MTNSDLRQHFPLANARGLDRLRRLLEHPHAPRYTHPGLDRLTPAGLRRALAYAQEIQIDPPRWTPDQPPAWLTGFTAGCLRRVPFYRAWGDPPARFTDLPTCERADLGREPWSFVPDDQPLDDLVVYNTSGTTGHPLAILTHADSLALYLPLLRAALAAHGIALDGRGQAALALVCDQRRTYTYAAVSAVLDQAGFVKINLNPAEWRDPADRARFLDDCAPQVITGDPISFETLARLPLAHRPRALVSTAMTLTPGLRAALQARFGCPVLDLYALNEAGPVGVWVGDAYHLLQPRLYVEVLDPEGEPCPPGVRGEVTLTGGFNPFLPLLRYRTHDHAALEFHAGQPVLVQLEGRAPVVFTGRDGRRVNNIDVSLALRPLPISQFTLHQSAHGDLRLRLRPGAPVDLVRAALQELFGPDQPLAIEEIDPSSLAFGKLQQYTRENSASESSTA